MARGQACNVHSDPELRVWINDKFLKETFTASCTYGGGGGGGGRWGG